MKMRIFLCEFSLFFQRKLSEFRNLPYCREPHFGLPGQKPLEKKREVVPELGIGALL